MSKCKVLGSVSSRTGELDRLRGATSDTMRIQLLLGKLHQLVETPDFLEPRYHKAGGTYSSGLVQKR